MGVRRIGRTRTSLAGIYRWIRIVDDGSSAHAERVTFVRVKIGIDTSANTSMVFEYRRWDREDAP
jgi:hypothetical protein